jgi:hypothetical protein
VLKRRKEQVATVIGSDSDCQKVAIVALIEKGQGNDATISSRDFRIAEEEFG